RIERSVRKGQAGKLLQVTEEILGLQKQRRGRQHRSFAVALQEGIPAVGVLGKAADGGLGVAKRDRDRVFGEVIKQGGRTVEKQRQVVLDTRKGNAVADITIG